MRILIVDDQPLNLKLLRAQLECGGHEVLCAADGLVALALLENETVDAIISDILMPRMDGYRLCHEVRRHPRLGKTPFIFYTATYTSPGDEKLCFDLGADKYLKKPSPDAMIMNALKEVAGGPSRNASESVRLFDELSVTEEYSERLVSKLEEKNLALERAEAELNKANGELRRANEELERRVKERTAELEAANRSLETFSYSVSHDLRAPLRSIMGFSKVLLEDSAERFTISEIVNLRRVVSASSRMAELIDSLMEMSLAGRAEVVRNPVDLSAMAQTVLDDLAKGDPGRRIETVIQPDLTDEADAGLVRIILSNLLSNAWKYTGKTSAARIEFGAEGSDGHRVYHVRDNGAGFDMGRVADLFQPFRRLHAASEFEGSGIGLATVRRAVLRHGGTIDAEGAPGRGATFRFTLGPTSGRDASMAFVESP